MTSKHVAPRGLHLGPSQTQAADGALSEAHNVTFSRAGQLEVIRAVENYTAASDTTSQPHDLTVLAPSGSDASLVFRRADGKLEAQTPAATVVTTSTDAVPADLGSADITQTGKEVALCTSTGLRAWDGAAANTREVGLRRPYRLIAIQAGSGALLESGESVAYRACFIRRDADNRLNFGEMSDRVVYEAAATRDVIVTVGVPEGVDISCSVQIYRSDISPAGQTPNDELFLVFERPLIASDITFRTLTITDSVDPTLAGAAAYTNVSQETALGNRAFPPRAKCQAIYQGLHVLANTEDFPALDFNLVRLDDISFASQVISTTAGGNTATVSNGAHFVIGQYVYMTLFNTEYARVTNIAGNVLTFDEPFNATTGSATLFHGSILLVLVQRSDNGFSEFPCIFREEVATGSVPNQIRRNARNFAQNATNWYQRLRPVRAPFAVDYVDEPNAAPGKLRFRITNWVDPDSSLPIKALSVVTRSNHETSFTKLQEAFAPELSGNPTPITTDANRLRVSPDGVREGFPLTNIFDVGGKDEGVVRLLAVQNSLVVVKERSLWYLQGRTYDSLNLVPWDPRLTCTAPRSAVVLRDQLIYLTDRGVVRGAPGGPLTVISGEIDDVFRTPTTKPIFAVGRGEEHQYWLAYGNKFFVCTIDDAATTPGSAPYRWTTVDRGDVDSQNGATSLPDGRLVQLNKATNWRVLAERRTGDLPHDYAQDRFAVTQSAASPNDALSTVTVPSTAGIAPGMAVVALVSPRRYAIVETVLSSTTLSIRRIGATPWPTGSTSLEICRGPNASVRYLPMHFGQMGSTKRFNDAVFLFETNDFRGLKTVFQSNVRPGADTTAQIYRAHAGQQGVRALVPGECRRGLWLAPGYDFDAPLTQARHLGVSVRYDGSAGRIR